jgi:endonuclease-3
MAAAPQLKASDKQNICRKLTIVLKKRYKGSIPKTSRPTLETILFAACLENASAADANDRYERLTDEFHDLNEIRVSSISELSRIFEGLPEPERRAMRVRNTLQYVFEKHFEFDFEAIRRKTFDAADRQLGKIKGLSPFVRTFALQAALGSHVVPVDQAMCNAAIWLGLVQPDVTPKAASEQFKSMLRKADAPQFCHLFRQLATDPKLKRIFESAASRVPEDGYDAGSSPERLTELFKNPAAARKQKTSTRTAVANKKSSSPTSRKKKSSASSKTAPPKKKTTARTGKSTTKKVTTKKVTAKKVTAKKVTAKKVTAKKVTAKKVTAKKVTAKKVTAKKVTAKKKIRKKSKASSR